MVNSAPWPTWLATVIRPPSRKMIPWQMDNPNPVPWPGGLVVKNGSKIFGKFSCRDAAARIADDDVHGIIAAKPCGDGDDPVFADGMGGVGEKIEDHLAQLGRIAVDYRQGLHHNGGRW